jgi:hypothetical protein
LFALIAFEAGGLFALGLWSVTGAAIAVSLITLAMSGHQPQMQLQTEHAWAHHIVDRFDPCPHNTGAKLYRVDPCFRLQPEQSTKG